MKIRFQMILLLVVLSCMTNVLAQEVSIPDPGLNAVIRQTLAKPAGPLTVKDLLSLTYLNAGNSAVSSLEGLAAAHNLTTLYLGYNQLTNLTLPPALTGLTSLLLNNNQLTGLTLPEGLTNLSALYLGANQLTNLTLPAGWTSLTTLDLRTNQLTSLTLAADLTNLTELYLDGNPLLKTFVLSEQLAVTGLADQVASLRGQGISVSVYPMVGFMKANFTVNEAASTATISLRRTGDISQPLTVNYSTHDGTATAGTDYLPQTGTIQFASLQTRQSFTIPILDDGFLEGDKTVLLTLSDPTKGAVLGNQVDAILTIEDNEIPTYLFDPSFITLPANRAQINAIVVQPDAKILVAGSFEVPGATPVIRLNEDGTRDSGFNAVTGFDGREVIQAMLLEPDGKVTIAGTFPGFNSTSFIISYSRLNSDGSFDAKFSATMSDTDFLPFPMLFIQPDGKLVIASRFHIVNGVRLNADGSVDQSFSAPELFANKVTLQPDGRLLIADGSGCVTRLNVDGSFDTSFHFHCGMSFEMSLEILATVVGTDGTILLGVRDKYSTPAPARLIAVTPDGALNTRWGPGVILDEITALAIEATGNVLIGGSVTAPDGLQKRGVLRFLPASLSEASIYFASGALPIGEEMKNATLTVLRSGDSIGELTVDYATATGSARPGVDFEPQQGTLRFEPLETSKTISIPIQDNLSVDNRRDFRMTLSNPSVGTRSGIGPSTATVTIYDNERPGSIDFSFAPPAFSATFKPVAALAVQADGKVLVSGIFTVLNPTTGLPTSAFRLNQDGSLDTSFELTVPIYHHPLGGSDAPIHVFIPLPDGKILIDGGIARLNSDGSLDDSFKPGQLGQEMVHSIALQPDGKILVDTRRSGLMRLEPSGELDPSFNTKLEPVGPDLFPPRVTLMLLQPDGKIIVRGEFTSAAGKVRKGMARLNSDGSLDTSFDPGLGPTTTKVPGLTPLIASMALQADGKILVAGSFDSFNFYPRTSYARLNPNGSLDMSFPKGNYSPDSYPPVSVAVQSDGRILLAQTAVVRLNSDGVLDQSFSASDYYAEYVSALVALPDGKVLAGGNFNLAGREAPAYLVRLNGDPPLRFSGIVRTASGALALSLASVRGRSYLLEGSSDLRTWLPLRTNAATDLALGFDDADAASLPRRFYRARLLNP